VDNVLVAGPSTVWSCGSWSGLAVAVGAAILLNVLLLVSFGWTELVGNELRITLWAGLGVSWTAAAVWSLRWSRKRAEQRSVDPERDRFGEALDHYLSGDYYQTEQILEGLLRQDIRDVDARLMLATLLRHTRRFDEATRQLDTLARLEGAGSGNWKYDKSGSCLRRQKQSPTF